MTPEQAQTLFGPGARFHHVGLGVRSIEQAVSGLEVFEDPIQRVRVAFTELAGVPIELIEPAAENSPIDQSLRKGSKLLHLCYEVPSLKVAMDSAKPHGFRKVSREEPAVAFEMRKIVWLFHAVFGLIELVEAEQSSANQ